MRFGLLCTLLFLSAKGVTPAENLTPLATIFTPTYYRLSVIPVLQLEPPQLCGHVSIDITARLSTTMLILHGTDLAIAKASVYRAETNQSQVARAASLLKLEEICFQLPDELFNELPPDVSNAEQFDDEVDEEDLAVEFLQDNQRELITILLSEPMVRGAKYRVDIYYSARVNTEEALGFYMVKYTTGREGDCCQRSIAATQLESIHARKVFPCLDEPAYKTPFEITVGHAPSQTVISNMPLEHSMPMEVLDDWTWRFFTPTPPMSTYLVAFVVAVEFEFVESNYTSIDGHNVTVRLWTQEHQLAMLNFSFNLVPKVLAKLETYLGVPYSLPKLDLLAIPGYDSGKAMENWGLIIHSDANLLSDDLSSDLDKSVVAVTVIHEIAHQFFGNLVTTDWWDDVWLQEGMTTLLESVVMKDVAPELAGDVVFIIFLEDAMKLDVLTTSHPLSHPVENFKLADEKFDALAYAKGAAIFRTARSFIGEEAFRSALNRYLVKYQYSNANSTDLWTLMNQEARRTHSISCRMSVARVMKTWTQQPGYPVVNVRRVGDRLHLSQRPFVEAESTMGNATHVPISPSWWIPITITDAEKLNFDPPGKENMPVQFLSPRKPSMELAAPVSLDSWVVVNVQSSGYYRVNYDRHNWDLLARQLLMDHTVIPAITRAQLIDDAFHLGHAKMISYEVAANLIRYLDGIEEDALVRKIARRHFDHVMGLITNGTTNQTVDKTMMDMYSIVSRTRRMLAARTRASTDLHSALSDDNCDAGDQMCVAEAQRLFRAMMRGSMTAEESKEMNQHFQSVWCAALRDGGDREWEFAWKKSATGWNNQQQKRKIMKALSCVNDPGRIKQLLSRVFNPTMSQQPDETRLIVTSLADNVVARPLALGFMLRNWEFLQKHLRRSSQFMELLSDVAKRSFSSEDMEKVKAFLAKHAAQSDAVMAERILSTMKSNVLRAEVHHQTVVLPSPLDNNIDRWK